MVLLGIELGESIQLVFPDDCRPLRLLLEMWTKIQTAEGIRQASKLLVSVGAQMAGIWKLGILTASF